MRTLFKLLVFLLLAILLFACLCKFFKKYKKWITLLLSCAISALAVYLLFLYPFENLFYQWDSPEELFHYLSWKNIEEVVYGEKSCMVVYQDSKSSHSQIIFPKLDGKYRIPSDSSSEHIATTFVEGGAVMVDQAKGTEDHYIVGNMSVDAGDSRSISDNKGSRFTTKTVDTGIGRYKMITFWAYIPQFDEDYAITTRGQEMKVISDQQ